MHMYLPTYLPFMMTLLCFQNADCTNAGVGSNLAIDGSVECDASIMDGKTLLFGAAGAISGLCR